MPHTVPNEILVPEIGRLLKEGKEVRFTPTGVSMRPFIEGGRDSVILRRLDRTPRRGDVLLCSTTSLSGTQTFVLHRVRKVTPENIILQGDGNIQGEETILPENVIGIVARIESPNGHRKPILRAYFWQWIRPTRWFWLKVYRHTFLKWCY